MSTSRRLRRKWARDDGGLTRVHDDGGLRYLVPAALLREKLAGWTAVDIEDVMTGHATAKEITERILERIRAQEAMDA